MNAMGSPKEASKGTKRWSPAFIVVCAAIQVHKSAQTMTNLKSKLSAQENAKGNQSRPNTFQIMINSEFSLFMHE